MNTLIWDFDGTLVEFNMIWFECIQSVIGRENLERCYSRDQVLDKCRKLLPWNNGVKEPLSHELWWDNVLARVTSEFREAIALINQDSESIKQAYREAIVRIEYIEQQDAMSNLAYAKHRDFCNVVATNNYPEIVSKIRKMRISQYIDDIITSSVIGYSKPSSGFLTALIGRYGDSKQIIVVGDSLKTDYVMAISCGFPFIYSKNSAYSDVYHNVVSQYFCEVLGKYE